MIAAWMLYALIIAALATGAAMLAERALRAASLGGRWAWAGAIALSFTLPLAALVRATPVPVTSEVMAGAGGVPYLPATSRTPSFLERAAAGGRAAVDRAAGVLTPALPARAERWNGALGLLWLIGSTVAVARLGMLAVRLHRVRRRWPRATVQGQPVLIADDVGPAVAGLDRGAIVLPRWAIGEDPDLLQLMVAHEREHVRGRDPWLLLAGALAAAIVPWNLVMHWQLRRLRLAVELDCDARVLRHHPDVRRYGALLLAVSARPRLTTLPLAAMADRPTTLERRIRAMTSPRPRFRAALAFGAAVPALLLVAVACETPRPLPLEPENHVSATTLATAPASDSSVYVVARAASGELRAVIAAAAAQGDPGAPVYVYRDTTGRVLSVRPFLAEAVDEVAVNDIASIEVVKGAAAARLFGEGASGGVINILLKSGDARLTTRSSAAEARLMKPGRVVERRATRSTAPDSGTVRVRMRVQGSPARPAAAEQARVLAPTPAVSILKRTDSEPTPLYIIDGVVITDPDAVSRLVPDSIANIEVLKGDAARAKYGARGADGVIVITTRGRM